ncbi:hypothetical protein L195_g061624 [Trifolium pratense]|uniref:Uncharacterized protein n=1 Tax=Trifolium pratense TaxID=57577 RepID=A0A2K3KAY4_TRIPR|nr:hypothetical protein L195_g061624 [Trifolium pratense]
MCKKPRAAGGKVFALDGGDVEADNLIRGRKYTGKHGYRNAG